MRWLIAASVAYVAFAVASLFTAFPFEAIAWTGLILILLWMRVDEKETYRAYRTC